MSHKFNVGDCVVSTTSGYHYSIIKIFSAEYVGRRSDGELRILFEDFIRLATPLETLIMETAS